MHGPDFNVPYLVLSSITAHLSDRLQPPWHAVHCVVDNFLWYVSPKLSSSVKESIYTSKTARGGRGGGHSKLSFELGPAFLVWIEIGVRRGVIDVAEVLSGAYGSI